MLEQPARLRVQQGLPAQQDRQEPPRLLLALQDQPVTLERRRRLLAQPEQRDRLGLTARLAQWQDRRGLRVQLGPQELQALSSDQLGPRVMLVRHPLLRDPRAPQVRPGQDPQDLRGQIRR